MIENKHEFHSLNEIKLIAKNYVEIIKKLFYLANSLENSLSLDIIYNILLSTKFILYNLQSVAVIRDRINFTQTLFIIGIRL